MAVRDANENQPQDAAAVHAEETRREILVPFLIGVALVVVPVIIALLLPRNNQTGLIADFLLTVFILCPAVICLLPIYLLMVVSAWGVGRLHDGVARPLAQVETFSKSLNTRTESLSDSVARRVISFSARFAKWDSAIFSTFDRPKEDRHDNPRP